MSILLERYINKTFVPIGWLENPDRGEWYFDVYAAEAKEEYTVHLSGCATSRRDAEAEVRREYTKQLKELKQRDPNFIPPVALDQEVPPTSRMIKATIERTHPGI